MTIHSTSQVTAEHSADADNVDAALEARNFREPVHDNQSATAVAMQNTLLTPRFYTTNFDELDAVDVSPVREEWDVLIARMQSDPNRGHFKKSENWDQTDWDAMEPRLRAEFTDFLISSCTAEFSGCVLYKEMKRRGKNKDITTLFQLMARDEARHAGFINDALREAGIAVNLAFLTEKKKYTYFKPKFIYYATYLSEKIGYARYITIFRHLQANPQYCFHPIFKWFEQWCNDEFGHGEAFALLMKTDPKLTSGINKFWIKFFLTAVYSTMFVRDHQRPYFHKALGIDPDWFAASVFRKTSEISRQVFPLTLDIDHPRWTKGLRALQKANAELAKARNERARVRQMLASARAAVAFLSLLTIPSISNEVPAVTHLEPAY
ncbi:MAG: magnesium-protoporphyrin IX monomethyl ester (oxidative) cyclase [Pseudohongiellaceae bacterium]|jgi:magnesium-protoporphyrin IX monomethyl ester (oxidative) cyclase